MGINYVSLYTEDERKRIWENLQSDIHKDCKDFSDRSELEKYIFYLESEHWRLTVNNNYLRREISKTNHYKNLAHVYKVELKRCVKKLTRIYSNLRTYYTVKYRLGLSDVEPEKFVKYWRDL